MKLLLAASIGCYLFGSHRASILVAGLIFESGYILSRGLALGRLPLVGPHDTLIFFSASITAMAVPFLTEPGLKRHPYITWIIGSIAAFFALAGLIFPPSFMPLPPILRTYWFELHVALAFFAYALFTLGALFGVFYLSGNKNGFIDLQHRAGLTGYFFFSLSMITGGIWGYYAWGTYWLWTAKEIWSTILWLYYSWWLHLRHCESRSERVIAWSGIAGFLVMLFTYLGVSLLMKSSHSF